MNKNSLDTKGRGCGIYPLIFRGWPKNSCNWHDDAYTRNSSQQKYLTRAQVDKALLEQLLNTTHGTSYSVAKTIAAYAMYAVVRAVGWIWWEGRH